MPETGVQESIEIHALTAKEVESGLFDPNLSMLVLTWVTFFLLLAVLKKFAWNPILSALDTREETIRRSLNDAERIRREIADIEMKSARLLAEAGTSANEIILQSRKAAKEAALNIENKARESAKISLENALREIKEEAHRAKAILRKESAQIAIELAGKLIYENLDTEKNNRLVDKFIKDI